MRDLMASILIIFFLTGCGDEAADTADDKAAQQALAQEFYNDISGCNYLNAQAVDLYIKDYMAGNHDDLTQTQERSTKQYDIQLDNFKMLQVPDHALARELYAAHKELIELYDYIIYEDLKQVTAIIQGPGSLDERKAKANAHIKEFRQVEQELTEIADEAARTYGERYELELRRSSTW